MKFITDLSTNAVHNWIFIQFLNCWLSLLCTKDHTCLFWKHKHCCSNMLFLLFQNDQVSIEMIFRHYLRIFFMLLCYYLVARTLWTSHVSDNKWFHSISAVSSKPQVLRYQTYPDCKQASFLYECAYVWMYLLKGTILENTAVFSHCQSP